MKKAQLASNLILPVSLFSPLLCEADLSTYCTASEASAFPKAWRQTMADIFALRHFRRELPAQDVARLRLKMNSRGQDAVLSLCDA